MADFRFDPEKIKCPECGEEADGIVEILRCRAYLDFGDDGSAFYDNQSDIWWDEQRPELDGAGNPSLICPQGHTWTVASLPCEVLT